MPRVVVGAERALLSRLRKCDQVCRALSSRLRKCARGTTHFRRFERKCAQISPHFHAFFESAPKPSRTFALGAKVRPPHSALSSRLRKCADEKPALSKASRKCVLPSSHFRGGTANAARPAMHFRFSDSGTAMTQPALLIAIKLDKGVVYEYQEARNEWPGTVGGVPGHQFLTGNSFVCLMGRLLCHRGPHQGSAKVCQRKLVLALVEVLLLEQLLVALLGGLGALEVDLVGPFPRGGN